MEKLRKAIEKSIGTSAYFTLGILIILVLFGVSDIRYFVGIFLIILGINTYLKYNKK